MKEVCIAKCPYRAELAWSGSLRGNLPLNQIFTHDSKCPSEWLTSTEPVSLSTEGHCLIEKPESDDSSCDITITPKVAHRLQGFYVVCDAKRVEVYADNEYCGTAKGLLEDLDEPVEIVTSSSHSGLEKVSVFLVTVPEESCQCRSFKVRFVSLCRPGSLVLFAMRVSMEPLSSSAASGPSLNMESVERWISAVGAPRDKRAEELLESVRRFQENRSSVGGDLQQMLSQATASSQSTSDTNLGGLLQMMSSMNFASMASNSSAGAEGNALASSIGTLMPHLKPMLDAMVTRKEPEDDDLAESPENEQQPEPVPEAESHGTAYVSHAELMAMETRLKQHIDQRFDAMQQFMQLQFQSMQTMMSSMMSSQANPSLQQGGSHLSSRTDHSAGVRVPGVAESAPDNGTVSEVAPSEGSTSATASSMCLQNGTHPLPSLAGMLQRNPSAGSAGAGGQSEAMLQSLMGMFKNMRPDASQAPSEASVDAEEPD